MMPALGFALTAWACVAAYGIWAWRDDRRAARIAQREDQERTAQAFDRIQTLIRQWADVRPPMNSPPPPPFPAEGDNFTTLTESNVTPLPFGKRPRTDTQPDGVA